MRPLNDGAAMEYYVGLDVSLKLTSICVVLFGANSNEGNARGGLHDARVLRVWSFGDIHPLEHDIQEKQMLCLRQATCRTRSQRHHRQPPAIR